MHEPLRQCVRWIAELANTAMDEAQLVQSLRGPLESLVKRDDWLPDEFAVANLQSYQQYLLYGDPLDRFSLVSFVWGPGQRTPIHDHTVWGLIGMLRGSEISTRYELPKDGHVMVAMGEERLDPGMVAVLPAIPHDIHAVRNAFSDRVSISVHLYGGNIGRLQRHVFDPSTSARRGFVSGYSSDRTPNLWA